MLVALWILSYALVKAAGLQGLDVDSAEQVYFAQSWQWGYGTRQPPLYTWVLRGLHPERWSWPGALEGLRYVLLALWLLAVQGVVRVCGASASTQAAAVMAHLGLSLALWRVHDSLTHTVLAALLVTVGSGVVVKALVQPRWWLLAGALAGLAALAKFNAGLWWVSAVAAAWWLAARPGRRSGAAPLGATMGWSLAGSGAAALVMAPYGLWWMGQRAQAGALVRQIAVASEQQPGWRPIMDVLSGVMEFLAVGPLLLSLAGVAAVVAWRWRSAGPRTAVQASLGERWMVHQALLAIGATVVVMLVAQGSTFKSRWLWPVVPTLGVWCVLWSARQFTAGSRGQKVWFGLAVAVAGLSVLVSLARWWEPGLNAPRCRECWTDRPATQMVQALHQRHGRPLRIVAGDTHLAGALAAASPDLVAWAATLPTLPPPVAFAHGPGACVLAWTSMDEPSSLPAALAERLPGVAESATGLTASWPLRHAPQRRSWLQSREVDPAVCAAAR